jgi:hypothetical protein
LCGRTLAGCRSASPSRSCSRVRAPACRPRPRCGVAACTSRTGMATRRRVRARGRYAVYPNTGDASVVVDEPST